MFLLSGCGKPIPSEKSDYVGNWTSPQMAILITQDGSVAYRRLNSGITTSINAPLKKFVGNNFIVGVGPVETTFEVTAVPHQIDGNWKMTIDGVELSRVQ
jgi:hypothetical protein